MPKPPRITWFVRSCGHLCAFVSGDLIPSLTSIYVLSYSDKTWSDKCPRCAGTRGHGVQEKRYLCRHEESPT